MAYLKSLPGSHRPLAQATRMTRFEKIVKDPRFRPTPAKHTKVKIDDRFKAVFKDAQFTQPYRVDKYGRPVETKDAAEREMKRFYRLESDQEAESDSDISTDASIEDDFTSSSSDESSYSESDDDQSVRGDSEHVDDSMDQAMSQHPLVSTDAPLGDATRRLAIVNMDWDQLKAVDLYVLVSAFKPAMGQVKSVKIYPSEFGKQRMAREALEGPPKEIFNSAAKDEEPSQASSSSSESDSDIDPLTDLRMAGGALTEEAGTFNPEALRRYQLERLRYYYAVIECDSVETAAAIYSHCDGREFETSTNALDLRYIPDEVEFDEAEVTDCATRIPKKYTPKPAMITEALQRSAVKLTWDQDDPDRKRITRSRLTREDLDEADLRAYLASDSEDDEEDNCAAANADAQAKETPSQPKSKAESKAEKIAKYRALLLESQSDNVFGRKSHEDNDELNITFTSGIMAAASSSSEDSSGAEDTLDQEFDEERVAVFDENGNLVPSVDPAKSKKKSKNKSKKEGAEAVQEKFIVEKDWSKQRKGKKMSRKRVKDEEEEATEFSVNLQDDRFKAVFEDSAFAIDPAAAGFKRTKGMEAIIAERQRRKRESEKRSSN